MNTKHHNIIKTLGRALIPFSLLVGCVTQKKPITPTCPIDMALVTAGTHLVCVDKYEYSSQIDRPLPERMPTGYKNRDDCLNICYQQGKRVLTHEEWRAACSGTRAEACNKNAPHPIIRKSRSTKKWRQNSLNCKLKENIWSPTCMNDPELNTMAPGLAKNAQFSGCKSDFGIYNMVGNLGEWVSDVSANGELGRFNGGLYPQPYSSCAYSTTAHGPHYKDYSIGCRCARSTFSHEE